MVASDHRFAPFPPPKKTVGVAPLLSVDCLSVCDPRTVTESSPTRRVWSGACDPGRYCVSATSTVPYCRTQLVAKHPPSLYWHRVVVDLKATDTGLKSPACRMFPAVKHDQCIIYMLITKYIC